MQVPLAVINVHLDSSCRISKTKSSQTLRYTSCSMSRYMQPSPKLQDIHCGQYNILLKAICDKDQVTSESNQQNDSFNLNTGCVVHIRRADRIPHIQDQGQGPAAKRSSQYALQAESSICKEVKPKSSPFFSSAASSLEYRKVPGNEILCKAGETRHEAEAELNNARPSCASADAVTADNLPFSNAGE